MHTVDNDGRTSEGEREIMWNDVTTAIKVLAGCVLGGCFAVALIVSTAIG